MIVSEAWLASRSIFRAFNKDRLPNAEDTNLWSWTSLGFSTMIDFYRIKTIKEFLQRIIKKDQNMRSLNH